LLSPSKIIESSSPKVRDSSLKNIKLSIEKLGSDLKIVSEGIREEEGSVR
jgi:hypothetical protein